MPSRGLSSSAVYAARQPPRYLEIVAEPEPNLKSLPAECGIDSHGHTPAAGKSQSESVVFLERSEIEFRMTVEYLPSVGEHRHGEPGHHLPTVLARKQKRVVVIEPER